MAESRIPVEELRDGGRVEASHLLDDPQAQTWIWQPLSPDDAALADAIETARMVLESA